ncbi:type I secretion system permease/ATPase [Castellaniella sp. GW247-6E4]|uniref:type I secretion system permease/ATPase n=1 Tax=Castellaniella sp. GW247-6E4 TaxID=3140380 RepID=UPI0033164BB7
MTITPPSEATSAAAGSAWRLPPHTTHDDPLLGCLVDLAHLHGNPCTAQALSSGLPLVGNRLTPALLPRAAARAQCSARVVRRPLEAIGQGLLPAILLLANDRACLLLEAHDDHYLVQYPETGTAAKVSAEALRADYSGLVCFVQPRFRFDARAPKTGESRGSHWFWSAILENRRLYRDALLSALLINIFAIVMPLFTMNVYDRVVPNNAIATLWVLVTGITLALGFNYILSTARAHVVDTASKRIDIRLSAQIMERILDLRMESRPISVGSFASNVRSFETIRDFIASASLTTLVDLPFILLFLATLAWISPWLVLPPAVAIILALGVSAISQMRMAKLVVETFKAGAQRNGVLVETIGGLETVKALNAQSHAQRSWEDTTRFLAHLGTHIKLISSATVGFVQMLQQLVSVAVIIVGVYLLQDGLLSLGGIIASSMLAGRCLSPLGQVAGLMMQYENARASLGSIDDYMNMPVEHPIDKAYVGRPALRGDIEFRNVSFSYPGNTQSSLREISFKILEGEKIGIVGRIGSGKSTLGKLILGLYTPSEGAVLIDGIDIRQIDPIDLRRAIGHAPQDPILFYGSLKHNLTLGAPFVDDADMLAAAALAGIDEFAARHPDGYDMIIGERGDSISGGQRQSIAIARALINNPPIVLLDEPSSNMDNQSEAALKARLGDTCKDKTLIIVTHRTAMLSLVDRLIIIDEGRIVADGPRDYVIDALREGRITRATRAA